MSNYVYDIPIDQGEMIYAHLTVENFEKVKSLVSDAAFAIGKKHVFILFDDLIKNEKAVGIMNEQNFLFNELKRNVIILRTQAVCLTHY